MFAYGFSRGTAAALTCCRKIKLFDKNSSSFSKFFIFKKGICAASTICCSSSPLPHLGISAGGVKSPVETRGLGRYFDCSKRHLSDKLHTHDMDVTLPKIKTLMERLFPLLKDEPLRDICEPAFVSGRSTEAKETFPVYDPANNLELCVVPDFNREETIEAIQAAEDAFKIFSKTTAKDRHDMLMQFYRIMMNNLEDLATLIVLENGKTFADAKSEIMYAAGFIEWFAEEARRDYGDLISSPIRNKKIITVYQPIGPVSLLLPWNFPAAMLTRKLGAALAAGCTCVVKPSDETPLTAIALARISLIAGFPCGTVNVVTTKRHLEEVGEEMASNPKIKMISFTGSTPVGKKLMRYASETVKRVSLELGGNAPFIIFDDADLEAAAQGLMQNKFRSGGQTCVCANRVYIHESVFDAFANKITELCSLLKHGHGLLEPPSTLGPLINKNAVQKISNLLDDAVANGAKVMYCSDPEGAQGVLERYSPLRGNFCPVVVLNCRSLDEVVIPPRIVNEEIFGPVICLYSFKTDEEVIRKANSGKAGLASYFYSSSLQRFHQIPEQLQCGMVGINTGILAHPEAPFSGIKESGFGIEGSHHGLKEYTHVKYLCVGV